MDAVTVEALTSLNSSLSTLLPPAAEPAHAPVLTVIPNRVTLTGVGGFVGVNADPAGEVVGRRVEAAVSITVKAGTIENLRAAVDGLAQSLVGADRAVLAQSGILSLSLGDLGPVSISGPATDQVAERELSAEVLYEFIKLPEQAAGVIGEIPLETDLVPGGNAAFLINTTFSADALDLFDVVDDPQVTQFAPSDWRADETAQRIEQLSEIRGGGFTPIPLKAGTYLVLKTDSARPAVRDFLLQVRLSSAAVDGIGVVFRWENQDNFYYFLMSAREGYRLMGRKVAGAFGFLESPALDESAGYDSNTEYELKLQAQGSDFTAYLNEEPVLSGADTALVDAGQVGFMCHGNNAAFFHSIKVTEFL